MDRHSHVLCCSEDVGSVTLRALRASQKLLKMGNTRNAIILGNYSSVKRWQLGKHPFCSFQQHLILHKDNLNPFCEGRRSVYIVKLAQLSPIETKEKQHHHNPLLNCTITKMNI